MTPPSSLQVALPLISPPVPNEAPAGSRLESRFDVSFVAAMALREKQIQQNYRPVIAVHKWFARRPGTLFRSLLLSEFATGPLGESFFSAHDLGGLTVADPFMGGGTPLLEANRLACNVVGWDINPMAWWIVREEIEELDLAAYQAAAATIEAWLGEQVGDLYRTRCEHCGQLDASVKYFLWVKTSPCERCGEQLDLFPGYLLAEAGRHPLDVLICPGCGTLNEVEDRGHPGACRDCRGRLATEGSARRNRCVCQSCGAESSYPRAGQPPPAHRLFAIEYHCQRCKPRHRGRFFKKPDSGDLEAYREAVKRWNQTTPCFAPSVPIPSGDETDRLHRWGYRTYREMFNERQLLGLELLCTRITRQGDERVRRALATNLSDLLRYQNMLCRYDTKALKSLDIFSVHGFPVGLVQCESNLLGIRAGRGTNVGSGGWSNIVEKFCRAKQYCLNPFEIRYTKGRKVVVPMKGEWIGRGTPAAGRTAREVDLRCGSATRAELVPRSLDAVLTDPPYFANVQYAELMDFCYVWLRSLAGSREPAFAEPSTRSSEELTGNATMARDLDHFTEGLSEVFRRMGIALKAGGPLVFTYHHNKVEAYFPIAVAMLDAGLVCTAALPCPAEMGGSIHIHGTGSSILDTVFVCRTTGSVPRRTLAASPEGIALLVADDLEQLSRAGVRLTRGDARCLAQGHLTRLAVWNLRNGWDPTLSWARKLGAVERAIRALGGPEAAIEHLVLLDHRFYLKLDLVRDRSREPDDEVSF